MTGIIIVVVIGLIAGLILSVASIVFAVPVDEKQEAVRACLPGANCGACGFSGCDGYAKALADGSAENGLCSPGGPDVAAEIAEVLGVSAGTMERKVAVVQCAGHCDNVTTKLEYQGIDTCQAVSMMFAGDSACAYGCLGHGDCAAACPENAITVCNGLATGKEDLLSTVLLDTLTCLFSGNGHGLGAYFTAATKQTVVKLCACLSMSAR